MKKLLLPAAAVLPVLLLLFSTACKKDDANGSSNNPPIVKFLHLDTVYGGSFQMGCTFDTSFCLNNETPVHSVTVSTFLISRYEITNHQYAGFLNDIKADPDGSVNGTTYINLNHHHCQIEYSGGEFVPLQGMENYPVMLVAWHGADAFCRHNNGRLPTEAEWEFAARGGKLALPTTFSGSNSIDSVAWYDYNSHNPKNHMVGEKGTHAVGTKAPNELGIYDMTGNVIEWCNDWYSDSYYHMSPSVNPTGPDSSHKRVVRGGSYTTWVGLSHLSFRTGYIPSTTYSHVGFRMVKEGN